MNDEMDYMVVETTLTPDGAALLASVYEADKDPVLNRRMPGETHGAQLAALLNRYASRGWTLFQLTDSQTPRVVFVRKRQTT